MDTFQRCKDGNDLVAKWNIDDEMTRSNPQVLGNAAHAVQGARGLIRSYLYIISISVVKERNKQK